MPSKLSACIGLYKLKKIICSLLGTNHGLWTPIIDGLADGLVWLVAIYTSPQKAIAVLQKNVQVNSLHQINMKTGIKPKKRLLVSTTTILHKKSVFGIQINKLVHNCLDMKQHHMLCLP